MATATPEQTAPAQAPDQQLEKRKEVLDAVSRRGIDEFQWRTLMNSLFPGARAESVLMVIDYCKARKLDPMKKPCHIVPMKVKDAKSGEYEWRDVVMPGIYEYRTTAMRTGNYLGHSKPEYGPVTKQFGIEAPEWCEMTFYRRAANGERIEFPVRVYFRESCATKFDKEKKEHFANDRWNKAPIQMLTKTTEAAGLREAFPDEFGGESTAEEMEGREQAIEAQVVTQPIKAAERISEQAKTAPAQESSQAAEPVTTVAVTTVAAETTKPAAAGANTQLEPPAAVNVGVITEALEKGDAVFAVLNTGFTAGTRNAEFQKTIGRLRDSKQLVELVCKAPTKPGFAPVIEEINPIVENP